MPTIKFLEPGGAATEDISLYDGSQCTSTDKLSFDSTVKDIGRGSMKFTSDGSRSIRIGKENIVADAGFRSTAYFRFAVLPSGACFIVSPYNVSGNNQLSLRLNVNGTMSLMDVSGGTIVTGTAVLDINTWYRIAYSFRKDSTGFASGKTYVNGVQDIFFNNQGVLDRPGQVHLTWGYGCDVSAGDATRIMWLKDVYVDDGTDLSDPGDLRVTAKASGTVNANNFDTAIGTSAVGERPLSVTNGKQQVALSQVAQNYAVESASAGDINISSKTILGYMGWAYAKRGAWSPTFSSVRSATNKTAGTTLVLTTAVAFNADQDLFIIVALDNYTSGAITCADNSTQTGTANVYSVDVINNDATSPGTLATVAIIHARLTRNILSTDTITITHPSVTARAAVAIAETSGAMPASASFDNGNYATYIASTTVAVYLTNGLQDEELAIGGIAAEDIVRTLTASGWTQPTGNIVGTTGGSAATNMSAYLAYKLTTVSSNFSFSGTLGAASDSRDGLAVYKTDAGGAQLTLNGIDYAKNLSLSGLPIIQCITSAVYPSNADAIGMKSTGKAPDTFLYECGIVVVYTDPLSTYPVPHQFINTLVRM